MLINKKTRLPKVICVVKCHEHQSLAATTAPNSSLCKTEGQAGKTMMLNIKSAEIILLRPISFKIQHKTLISKDRKLWFFHQTQENISRCCCWVSELLFIIHCTVCVCIPRNVKEKTRDLFCLKSVAQFLFINSFGSSSVSVGARNIGSLEQPRHSITIHLTMFNLLYIDLRQMMQNVNIDGDVSINSVVLNFAMSGEHQKSSVRLDACTTESKRVKEIEKTDEWIRTSSVSHSSHRRHWKLEWD